MSSYYSNSTRFGVEDRALRNTYAAWSFVVFLASSIGDSIILLSSLKYNTIIVNRIIVTYIEQIAVCDIMIVVRYYYY